ncbi:Hypothetical predicted protein [Mytilus galloprovincialis]|uniref:Endonuclease/exonuclease/phosphatase domain-containing protein n=1 Tax=Mytilus galloprovincialis TaxID=29158 RepID=A0A8B6D1H4_MYTGA|nr:Hypothetical predicted protein [Mytilus galloprovincialis]
MWPSSLNKFIHKLPDGNSRVMAIKIELENHTVCLINAYMPTLGQNSQIGYSEHLDIVSHITEKYSDLTHILCGDLNGTLKTSRKNPHDKLLRAFKTQGKWINKGNHLDSDTFFHHNGLSSSQIDYILTQDLDIVDKILIENTCGNNLSTHVPVFGVLAAKIQSNNIKKSSNSGEKFKIEWDRADLNKYQEKLKETLQENQSPNLTSTELVGNLIYCLKKAEKFAIPSRIIKLNGPKLKVSAETKILLNISKQKHRIWDIGGRKRGLDDSFTQLKEAKYNARKMIRKERAMERKIFYSQLEQKPSSKTFFQLIKRNLGNNKNSVTQVIRHEEKDITCPDEQREVLAKYYKNLATPKDDTNFNEEYLHMCQLRCNIIKELSENYIETKINFTEEEIIQSIKNLNSGKAGDEYGLFAEHLKLADKVIIPYIYTKFF